LKKYSSYFYYLLGTTYDNDGMHYFSLKDGILIDSEIFL